MKFILYIISWVFAQALISGMCSLLYIVFLKSLIGINISLFNWFGIVCIVSLLIPTNKNNKNNNDKGSRINSFIEDIMNAR